MSKKNEPADIKLYESVKKEAKKRFKVWPSAYASGWLVKEYKRRFGEIYGTRKNPYKSSQIDKVNDLGRWYKEDWRNVCQKDKNGEYKKCGRTKASEKNYPYCRPLNQITKDTPKTVRELTRKERQEMCRKKSKSMKERR